VSATSKSHAFDGRLSPARDFMNMIELQESPFTAPMAIGSHECASIAISEPHGAPDGCRDGSRVH
jgi:hypothetical protein